MEQVTYGNKKIRFKIKRGRRKKTVALYIQPNYTVIVLTPQFLEKEKIKEIILRRAKWILRKQEIIRKSKAYIPKKEFVSGESFPYLGRLYRLKAIRSKPEKDRPCKLVGNRLYVEIDNKLSGKSVSEFVRKKIIEWYIEQATEKIHERIKKYSKLIGKEPKKIIIKNQEKRWGSCSHSGIIRFNWKIIMPPISVLDYVIVHELCHLIYPNHSADFWHKVESIIPDCKKKREWLKEKSFLLAEFLG